MPCALALAVLVLGAPARATAPLITDASGDATPTFEGTCGAACPLLSEPAVDITTADIGQSGSVLAFTIEVTDLDHVGGPAGPKPDDLAVYQFSFRAPDDVTLGVTASRTFAHTNETAAVSAHHYDGQDHNEFRSATVSFDDAADTVTVEVDLATLNDALSAACGTCATVGTGTVLDDVSVGALVLNAVAGGHFPRTYADGAGGFGYDYTVS